MLFIFRWGLLCLYIWYSRLNFPASGILNSSIFPLYSLVSAAMFRNLLCGHSPIPAGIHALASWRVGRDFAHEHSASDITKKWNCTELLCVIWCFSIMPSLEENSKLNRLILLWNHGMMDPVEWAVGICYCVAIRPGTWCAVSAHPAVRLFRYLSFSIYSLLRCVSMNGILNAYCLVFRWLSW